MTGDTHDRYLLLREIAAGETSTVHAVWDLVDNHARAVKILEPGYASDRVVRNRLSRAARAMARCDHPNVIGGGEVGTDGDTVFLVMELAEGGSLHDWLERNGRMPPKLAVQVALDVLGDPGAARVGRRPSQPRSDQARARSARQLQGHRLRR